MEDYLLLGIALLIAGGAAVTGIVAWEMVWKPRRQRRIERDHARSKVGKTIR